MAERTEDTDQEVCAMIRAHLAKHGRANQAEIYKAIEAMGYKSAEITALAAPILNAQAATGIARNLTAAEFAKPEPSRAAAPARVDVAVNPRPMQSYMTRLRQLDEDVQKSRAHALIGDPTSPDGTKIRFPAIFLATVDKQARALELAIKVGSELYALDRVNAYFNRLAEIIRDRTAEAPELRDALMADMDALNTEFMSMGEREL